MMKAFHLSLILLVLLTSLLWAGDKHPDRTNRDQYIHQMLVEMEHNGVHGMRILSMYPAKAGCGKVCFSGGNHDGIRILADTTVQGIDEFIKYEIKPRIHRSLRPWI